MSDEPASRVASAADHAAVAAPEAPDIVAETVVPFEVWRREIAELIAAGPDVPGLGDQHAIGEHGIAEIACSSGAFG